MKVNVIDTKHLTEENVQMTNEWIRPSDALPKDFGLDWVLVIYKEKSSSLECIPTVAACRKGDNLWHCRGTIYEDEVKYFNSTYIVQYWRPIDGTLPKRIHEDWDKHLQLIMDITEDYIFPKELFHYVDTYYDKTEYSDRNIVFNALKYGYAFCKESDDFPHWISVNERLPEEEQLIVLHTDTYMYRCVNYSRNNDVCKHMDFWFPLGQIAKKDNATI